MASLEGDNLVHVEFYYLNALKLWPDKRGGLLWEWSNKRCGLWWEWSNKRETIAYLITNHASTLNEIRIMGA